MNIDLDLEEKLSKLKGFKVTESGANLLHSQLPSNLIPFWFITFLKTYPLDGQTFCLDEDKDDSEMGVEMKWISPHQMIEEAKSFQPGKSVLNLGYLPIGMCLLGSGDPYFLNFNDNSVDPAIVRIPHNLASEDKNYPLEDIELVCESLSRFLMTAEIEE